MTQHPNQGRRSSAGFWVRGIAETLEAEGLDVEHLFDEAGLKRSALRDPDARFPTENVSQLWRLAVKHSGNPMIGLRNWHVPKPASFDVVAYAMMSSPNLLGVLERVMRYVRIVSDAASIAISDDREGYRLILKLSESKHFAPWQQVAFDLLTFLSFCRWVTTRDLRPLALDLAFPSPTDVRELQDPFGFPLRFDAAASALLFSHEDTMLTLPTAHEVLAEVHERIAREQLNRLDYSETQLRARTHIYKKLPDGEPSRADVARALAMSERTFHRRLEAEGTTFRRLLDDTRRELAEQYLGRSDLSLADVAYMLGYGDQSSFYRGCKRWFGTSPQQYRDRLKAGEPSRSPQRPE